MKRKEPKIHKEPVGSLTSNRRGQCPLSTPPEELETFVVNEGKSGNWSDFRVLSLLFFRKPKRETVPNFKLVQNKNLSSDWGIDFFKDL